MSICHLCGIKDKNYENESYFRTVSKILSHNISQEMLSLIKKLEYESFRDKFELIEENEFMREDIIINADEISSKLINDLQNTVDFDSIEVKNKFRRLNEYRVAVPKKDLDNINTKPIHKFGIAYVDMDDYDENLGVIRKNNLIF